MKPNEGKVISNQSINSLQAKILKELLADGRKSDSEIAEEIGSRPETVKRNFIKLKKNGIITGATTHINYRLFGYKAVAHVLINVDPKQSDQLITYLQKMPGIYSCQNAGIKGNIGAVTILKTLEQLNEIKDEIRNRFSVLEMKTAIWTDVKEMNENLAIIDNNKASINFQAKTPKNNPENITIDQIDQKIADKLAENGRIPMETLAKEIGISPEKAKKRYEKLKKNGALKITIQINPYKIGYRALCIFFTVTSNEESFVSIDKISQIPDVISIMKTTGDYDLQIYAMVKNIEQLLSIQEEIGKTTGIMRFDLQMLGLELWEKWPSPRQYISTF